MPMFGWEEISRSSADYKTCLQVTSAGGAIIGAATGSVVPVAWTVAGIVSGAFWGFVAGYIACPYLSSAVRHKLEQGTPLTHLDILNATEAMGHYAQVIDARDAIKLVATIKMTKASRAAALTCRNPEQTATDILNLT